MKNQVHMISVTLAFVRSGNVRLAEGYMSDVGGLGYSRSRTASSITNAYRLLFFPSGLNMVPAYRYYAFPLRCLRILEGTHEKIV